MRRVVAVIAGVPAAIIAYWCGAVVALLLMHGIPLGSTGGPATNGDVSLHLVLAVLASFGGALVAIRIARSSPLATAWATGLLLGAGAIAGFSKPASQWPAWFAFGMAAASILGAVAAGRWAVRSK